MPFHPEIASRLELLDGIPSMAEALANPELRPKLEAFDSYPDATPPPFVRTEDRTIGGPNGPVPVRVYYPDGTTEGPRPGLVWIHGGGFRFGDLDMKEADWTARELANRAGAIVVSVDYRLAVEGVTYPVPLDDVIAAIRWVRRNRQDLGIVSTSIGGASAGANLAAGAALRLRDEENWTPAHLVLVYPTMHAELPKPSTSLELALAEMPPAMRLPTEIFHSMTENYLSVEFLACPGYAMPASADLGGLGPTIVLNAEYDDLRASGEAFSASSQQPASTLNRS